jgi:SAM-dependent methyltransferase
MHAHDDAAFWDAMYRRHPVASPGEPDPCLAEDIAGLTAGTALDVGCGEGADAIALARRGWRVTAVDFSDVALERARAADVDRQVTWIRADVRAWEPPADAFDLVSTRYLHVPPAERAALFGRLARAIRPGGMLRVVAHHPSDLETTIGRPPLPDLYFTTDEVAAWLAPGQWAILFAGTRPHRVIDPAGRPLTIRDMVLRARRTA